MPVSSNTIHPLDPLSASEIASIASICKEYDWKTELKGKFASSTHAESIILRFNTITLKEPKKIDLISFLQTSSSTSTTNGIKNIPRQAFVILQFPPDYLVVEAVVEYSDESSKWTITSWITKKDIQPLATPDDCFDAEAIAKADSTVQELLKTKYDLTVNMDFIVCDPWSVHGPPTELKSNRLIQLFMYMRNGHEMDNAYAHPISFTPIVDLNLKKVVRIDEPFLLSTDAADATQPPKIPMTNINYHKDLCEVPMRTDLKPLIITQPEGSSWIVNGNEIQWQKWNIRISFNYREGLVLHTVTYNDNGKVRPILHRASLVEMAVPYGDVNEPFTRKCAFDVGDYGLGNCANSLDLGCDCLGNIHYFDGVLNNCQGEAVVLKKAICMHEEDHGTLWKHVEYRNRDSQVRRSRRLVLSFVSTVVNYEYAFYWYFYQDGTVQYEIRLTGELSTNALSPDEITKGDSIYGTMVADGVNAQFHQHLFCVRLDMSCDDVQGGKNCLVSEVDLLPLAESDTKNPAGNGFTIMETPLIKESLAQRIYDVTKQRTWKISNPSSIHSITKKPVAWKLVVPASPLLLATPSSLLTKRGKFATKTIWVTPHADDEKWPAGDYTIQSEGGEGLEAWTKADRDCGVGCDPVIWLTLAATHIPRVEDFPVMPCETVTFSMKPFNFFNMNPGVDVPPTSVTSTVSVLAGESSCCAAGGVAKTE